MLAGQMMAVREKMGLTVRELLLAEEMKDIKVLAGDRGLDKDCLLYTSPSPRDA